MRSPVQSIADILKSSKTIAIVGLSDKPERDSHQVAHYLQQHGYRIIPVNPILSGTQILGETCYPGLQEAAHALSQHGIGIDVVDCFRKSESMPGIAVQAVQIGARILWMQLGVINESAAKTAQDAGLQVVMDHCMKIEHARHFTQAD